MTHDTLRPDADQSPVPSAWRGPIEEAVHALATGRYEAVAEVPGFRPLDPGTITQIEQYLGDYGATLAPLPAATWDSSVASGTGDGWEVLVDLFTEEEGASDLVLHLRVDDEADGPRFSVHLVYVP